MRRAAFASLCLSCLVLIYSASDCDTQEKLCRSACPSSVWSFWRCSEKNGEMACMIPTLCPACHPCSQGSVHDFDNLEDTPAPSSSSSRRFFPALPLESVLPTGEVESFIVKTQTAPSFFVATHSPADDKTFSRYLHAFEIASISQTYAMKFLMQDACKQKKLFVDVGAHFGYFSFYAAALGCDVMAYEPQERLLPQMALAVTMNAFGDRLNISNFAVSDGSADVTIYEGLMGFGAATAYAEHGGNPLNTAATARLSDHIDEDILLLKISAAGHSHRAMKGAFDLMKKHKIEHIFLEFGGWSDSLEDSRALLNKLVGMGYSSIGTFQAEGLRVWRDSEELLSELTHCAKTNKAHLPVSDTQYYKSAQHVQLCMNHLLLTPSVSAMSALADSMAEFFAHRKFLSFVDSASKQSAKKLASVTLGVHSSNMEFVVHEGQDPTSAFSRFSFVNNAQFDAPLFRECLELLARNAKSTVKDLTAAAALHRRTGLLARSRQPVVLTAAVTSEESPFVLHKGDDEVWELAKYCLREFCSPAQWTNLVVHVESIIGRQLRFPIYNPSQPDQ